MDHGKLKHGAHTSLAIGAEAPAGDEDLGSSTTSAISTRALLLGANGSDGNVDTKNVYNDGTAVDLDVDLDLDVENGNGATSALPRAPGKPRKKRAVTETPSRCLLASLAVLLCTLVVGAGCWVIVNRLMHPLSGRASSTFERPVTGMHGAVATEHGTCSQIGVDLLKEGGNALDAAIAGALCIGVVNSFSSGVGGYVPCLARNFISEWLKLRIPCPMRPLVCRDS